VEAAFVALGPLVTVERVGRPSAAGWSRHPGRPPQLEPAVFDRALDVGWRRVSYSGITRGLHEQPGVGSEPELELTSDEGPSPLSRAPGTEPDERRSVALHLGAMPGGALVGTVVHGVLERADFCAPDLEAELREALDKEVAWRNVDLGNTDAVITGLRVAIESSLGALTGGLRLRDVARRDRLDELGFEIPLVGGDAPTGRLDVAHIGDLLLAQLPADDPVARYAPALRDPGLDGMLRGYLTGSLDLVVRLPDGRYAVADYKTNKLGASGEVLTAWHYRDEAVQQEMVAAHYPLQALLYSVALHRYLRWRLPDYRAARHLAGVLYLFVRGMSAVESVGVRASEPPLGVWTWQPPPDVVEAMSDLFDRGVGS
jgi:exodeoxyribonuclease V beta subunit